MVKKFLAFCASLASLLQLTTGSCHEPPDASPHLTSPINP